MWFSVLPSWWWRMCRCLSLFLSDFFPFNSSYSSGFIMPTYGDEMNRGFYLRDGGYYFAISDRMDLKVLGEIFTKGSWGLSVQSNITRDINIAVISMPVIW